jgi:glycosyltransferase involved in cell wall biosynthesis
MRVVLWHAWALEGSGSNVFAAEVTRALRRAGNDVLILSQDPHPDRFDFLDEWGVVDGDGVSRVRPTGADPAAGRAVLLRPDVGSILPSFLGEPVEGFCVKRFVDLSDAELNEYLDRNTRALRAAVRWHGCDMVVAGHAVPGAIIARRTLGHDAYGVVVHGSDLEHAVRLQRRYRDAAKEGLEGARVVIGPSRDVLDRVAQIFPSIADRSRPVRPGVDGRTFRPAPRPAALARLAAMLERDGIPGDPAVLDRAVEDALQRRDREALNALSFRYDGAGHDHRSADRLRSLARAGRPLIGYLGRLAPQKGTDQFIEAIRHLGPEVGALIVGFGPSRAWLTAFVSALDDQNLSALRWLEEVGVSRVDLGRARAARMSDRVIFTGRLEHRDVPPVVTAVDVLVIPSHPPESFGMVAVEAAAGGALPLMPRHSGLAETAIALEAAVGRPGLFSYPYGPSSAPQIAAAVRRLLAMPADERRDLRTALRTFVTAEWTWGHTVDGLLRSMRQGAVNVSTLTGSALIGGQRLR